MIRAADRRRLRELYERRCGYCNVAESDVGAELTADHFQPKALGGSDDFPNLVYACHACNEFKGDYWQPDAVNRILRPLHDDVSAHIAESADCLLVGLTPTGTFHIQKLQLNREALVEHRQKRRREATSLAKMASLETRLAQLEERIRFFDALFGGENAS